MRNDLTRLTIDLPKAEHKKLKTLSATSGLSMREIVIQAIDSIEECVKSEHVPNKKLRKVIKEAREGKNLETAKDVKDLFKKLAAK